METISNAITEFLNIPAVQIVLSVLSVVYGVIRIIASTSIGKKALNELKEKYAKSEFNCKTIVEEHKKIVEQKDNELTTLSAEYDIKLNAVRNYAQNGLNQLKNALSCINNDEVKRILSEIDLTIPTDITISGEVEKAKQEVKDYYEENIKQIVLEVLENGKEAINNNTTQE